MFNNVLNSFMWKLGGRRGLVPRSLEIYNGNPNFTSKKGIRVLVYNFKTKRSENLHQSSPIAIGLIARQSNRPLPSAYAVMFRTQCLMIFCYTISVVITEK